MKPYKKHYKKSLLFVICILLFMSAGMTVFAAQEDQTSLADYLKEMGLFQGTDAGYQLDESTNRGQAAVMVVRLLGKEDEALTQKYEHPFLDVPGWLSPYVGYLWQNGITNGVGQNTYGSQDLISSAQYMTLLLRVLSYNDALGDFKWDESINKAYMLNILSQEDYHFYQSEIEFLRNDLVLFTYEALSGDLKEGQGRSLLQKLIGEKVVPKSALLDYLYAPYTAETVNEQPENINDFHNEILQGIFAYKDSITLDISKIELTDTKAMINEATDRLIELPAYASILKGWSSSTLGNEMTLTFHYMIPKYKFDQATNEAKNVANKILTDDMSDYEKELAIHDYIVDSSEYYTGTQDPNEIYTIYGLFVDKEAVCQGYADAFFYLATYAGIQSHLVYGEGISEDGTELHAWNVIELEGEYYAIDTTWNDPVTDSLSPVKQYDYFNITDGEIGVNHKWIAKDYPVSTGKKYNYFLYNNLVVHSVQELGSAIINGMNAKKKEMIYKTEGFSIDKTQLRALIDNLPWRSCSLSVNEYTGIVEIRNIEY